MARDQQHHRFTLTLAAPRGDSEADATRRLRAALKRLWRGYSLRCTSVVREQQPGGSKQPYT